MEKSPLRIVWLLDELQPSASDKVKHGAAQIETGQVKRKLLQKAVRAAQEDLARLTDEAVKAADEIGIWDMMWGDDEGLGDIQDQIGQLQADLGKQSKELEIESTEIEMALQEVQNAQSQLSQRSGERQQVWDEFGRAGKASQS